MKIRKIKQDRDLEIKAISGINNRILMLDDASDCNEFHKIGNVEVHNLAILSALF